MQGVQSGHGEVILAPLADITLATSATPNPACAGSSVALSVTAAGGVTPYNYTWLAPPGITLSAISASAVSASVGAAVSGVQTLTITVQTLGGTPSSTSLVTLSINSPPSVSISPSTTTLTCATPSVSLSAIGSGTYQWNTGATTSAISVSTAGTYSVTLTGANGCSSTTSASVVVADNHPDYQALVDFYNATNGPNWTNKARWLTSCNPCMGNGGFPWYGVNCLAGRVSSLELPNNGLSGSIPASLSALTNLQVLRLSTDQLSGSIPSSLSALMNLQRLDLGGNRLSGSIPASLSVLTNLQNLYLSANQLSGSIPPGLGSLTKLQELTLNNNQLSGSIPSTIGSLTKLQYLDLTTNQLSGIPESMGSLINLKELRLNDNRLSGSIPASLSALTNLIYLNLYNNQLSGSIPASLGSLTNLLFLNLNNNQLSGSIPASLGSMTNLAYLNLYYNQLSGSIPASLANLTNLQSLALSNNQLSGCWPASLTALCGLAVNSFFGNAGLPGGGSNTAFAAFCTSGQGSDDFVAIATASAPTASVGGVVSLSTAGGSSYRWIAPAGAQLSSPATARVVSATLTQAGLQTFTVVVSNGTTCSQTATVSVTGTGSALPTLSGFAATSSTVCVGSPVTFTATVGNVTGSYTYTLTNGSIGTPTGPLTGSSSSTSFSQSLVATSSGNQSYTLIIRSNDLSASATSSLVVNALPTPSLQASGTLTCAMTSVTLTASGGNTGETFSYNFSGPGLVSQNDESGTAVVNEAGTYSVTVTVAGGCLATTSTSVSSNTTPPTANILAPASTTLTCTTTSISLTATGGGTYRWDNSSTNALRTITTAGTYSVTVTAPNGCTAVDTQVISGNTTAPTATILAPASTTLTCTTTSISLTATGGGTYRWDNNSTNALRTITTAGTYSVTVTAPNGCTASASATVSADQTAPTVSITPSSATLTCANPSVTLTAIGTGSVRWSTGSTQSQISVSAAATYSVTLTSPGGCTATASATVSADQTAPTVSITPSSATLTCANPSVTLTAIGTGSVRWSTGSTSTSISVSSTGTYSVTLTSPGGCTTTASATVSADQTAPTVSISPSSATLTCANPSVTLTAIGTGSVRWSTGSTQSQISVSSTGTYSVTLTSPGGCTATASATVSADQTAPTVSISPSSATLTCANPSVTLTAIGTGSVRWSTGSTSTSISVSSTGTYSVTLTSPGGCTTTASATVVGDVGVPTAGLTNNGPISCSITSVTLTASGGGTYQFSTGTNQIGNGPTATVSSAGVYSVTVVSGNGCSTVASTTVVGDQSVPVVSILANPSLTIVQGQSTVLMASVSGSQPLNYTWSTNQSTSTISVSTAGPYSVTVVSGNGCSAAASVVVSVTAVPVISGPFAITGVSLVNCTPINEFRKAISFNPQYDGLDGSPVSFSVANELRATTDPGPYTLNLYTDNPTIILRAVQSGVVSSFAYNWLAACQTSQATNTPPRLVSSIASQTAQSGTYFTFVIPDGTFADDQTPLNLHLSATGIPPGLSFAGATMSGVPSTSVGSPFSVTITATDPGNLSISTQFQLTVLPASSTPPPTAPFAITGVTTISCTPVADRIQLSFAPQYAGLTGQPIAFEVVNELAPTTDPAPYSLALYRDNPVLVLKATQTGSMEQASFRYNWLEACASVGQNNTAPRVDSPVGNQTATVGVGFSLNLSSTFIDQETPDQISLQASGLPEGIHLVGTSLSGIPSMSGVSSVTLTATDGGGLSTSISFMLTVSPASSQTVSPGEGFRITGVQTLSCITVNSGLRSVVFQPLYAAVNGQPIRFSVINELAPTMAAGPYTLSLYTDNPVITLKATQQGSPGEASYVYSWLSGCSSARLAATEPGTGLQVKVLSNPVEGKQVELEIQGVSGQPVEIQLVDQQGKRVAQHQTLQAAPVEMIRLPVGQSRGMLLLGVQSGQQKQQLKVIVP